MLAMQNVETLNTAGAKRIVVTCAHCFNTLANEYPQVGGHYEVVHHTTLLARLVAEGKIAPVHRVDAATTYHDPCYLGPVSYTHLDVYKRQSPRAANVVGSVTPPTHRLPPGSSLSR